MALFSNKKNKGAPLGQHFLTSRYIARDVCEAVDVTKGETILEVGPGKGILTHELLEKGASLIAVEKDSEMVIALKETFAKEISNGQLTLYEEDARTFLLNAKHSLPDAGYKVVANIPYYITGELLRLFLTAPVQPTAVSLLVQKEVAERIAREKKESILSLSVKAYGTPRYVKTVKAGSFNPAPKVDSAILAITNISRKNFTPNPHMLDVRHQAYGGEEGVAEKEKRFFELLHVGFGQKRKTLLGNIKRAFGSEHSAVSAVKIEKVFEKCNLDKKVRAEDVPLETWLILARELL